MAKRESHRLKIHGKTLVDDYFWLRNKNSEDVVTYLNAENAYAEEMMADTKSFQEQLFQEMKGRIKETDQSAPMKHGNYFHYYRTEEGKDYRIHCRKHMTMNAPEEIILDGNDVAKGRKYMSIGSMKISPDHRRLAYSVDFTGGTTYDIRIVDLDSGRIIDTVEQVGGQIEWDWDNNAIFYSKLDSIHRDYAISLHVVGTRSYEDEALHDEPDTSFYVVLSKSSDKKYLFIKIGSHGSETIEVRYLELERPDRRLETFLARREGVETDIQHHHGYFYFSTNLEDLMRFKLMKTPVSDVSRASWKSVISQSIEARQPWLLAFENHLVIGKRKDGYGCFTIYDFSTGDTHDIELPESVYALEVPDNDQEFESDSFRLVFSSAVTPTTVYDYNMATRKLETKKIDEIRNHSRVDFVTERRYATAKDGTKVPISIAYRKGTKMNGGSPLVLYGYGSYGFSADPSFDSMRLSLIQRGIIQAFAHVRGGGEYGKLWYHQGKLSSKLNTFTDFVACADYLVHEGFTSRDRLCIFGGSAGGLLIGAVLNLRPDLFACAVPRVPFVDVINTMLDDTIPLTTFEYKEWGDPRIEIQFDWMIRYSPYDNVKARKYPPMLITAGYNDPSVAYWEPAKWTAKLRSLKTDGNLLLLKTRMESGHAGLSGRYEDMKDRAFIYAFIFKALDKAA